MGTLESELGPHVEELTTHPRVYVDANVPAGAVRHMRRRLKWDVLAVIEDEELRRASDIEHYRMARKLRRTLISLDDDFLDDRRFPLPDSGGTIILSAPNERGLNQLLSRVNRVFFAAGGRRGARPLAPPLVGQKIQVHPDWTHPALARGRRRRNSRSTRARSHPGSDTGRS